MIAIDQMITDGRAADHERDRLQPRFASRIVRGDADRLGQRGCPLAQLLDLACGHCLVRCDDPRHHAAEVATCDVRQDPGDDEDHDDRDQPVRGLCEESVAVGEIEDALADPRGVRSAGVLQVRVHDSDGTQPLGPHTGYQATGSPGLSGPSR